LNQNEFCRRCNAGEEGTPMLRVVTDEPTREQPSGSVLDELVSEGARRMLAAALEAEVDAYIEAHAAERDERGRRLVVRNGHAEPRSITTGAGPVEIEAPRVNDRRVDAETGERVRFRSAIVPPWCRKSPKVAEVLPLMYLHGMSTGDFVPALEEFFGSAAGLSSSVIARLTKQWQAERDASCAATSPTWTSCTCGSTASTSTSASRRSAFAPWSWWASGSTAPRSSWR
jgi:putative transposase